MSVIRVLRRVTFTGSIKTISTCCATRGSWTSRRATPFFLPSPPLSFPLSARFITSLTPRRAHCLGPSHTHPCLRRLSQPWDDVFSKRAFNWTMNTGEDQYVGHFASVAGAFPVHCGQFVDEPPKARLRTAPAPAPAPRHLQMAQPPVVLRGFAALGYGLTSAEGVRCRLMCKGPPGYSRRTSGRRACGIRSRSTT